MADVRNDCQLPSVPEGVMLPSPNSGHGGGATTPPDTQRRSTVTPPSPFITRRERRDSLSERAAKGPVHYGIVKYFCREKGHGYITSYESGEDVFVHISDIEGEYVPHEGDEMSYKLCPIPPKFEKVQAVHAVIKNLAPDIRHERWDQPIAPHKHRQDVVETLRPAGSIP